MPDTLDEAIEYRLRAADEAIRQNAMLRHTLAEKVRHAAEIRDTVSADNDLRDRQRAAWMADAYTDVLSLLGPEPAWYTDPDTSEPF